MVNNHANDKQLHTWVEYLFLYYYYLCWIFFITLTLFFSKNCSKNYSILANIR